MCSKVKAGCVAPAVTNIEFRRADLEDLLFGDKSSDALWYASLAFSLCRI
jgi:ubiquinone/menaquinone biosynthesis C-methylase UbiE